MRVTKTDVVVLAFMLAIVACGWIGFTWKF